MDVKERLKASQGSNRESLKLNITRYLKMGLDEDKNSSFVSYDKDEKKNEHDTNSLTGVYLGSCMKGSAYDDNLGSNGGQYQSDYHFNNEHIVLFKPTATKFEIAAKGTKDEVEAWAATNTTGGFKRKLVLFIATPEGIVEVQTNMSIGFGQLKKFKNDLTDNMIVLTPQIYSENNKDIDAASKKILGKLAKKNPPCYASISIGDPIDEMVIDTFNLGEVIDEFIAWKEFKMKKVEPKVEAKPEAEKEELPPLGSQTTEARQDYSRKAAKEKTPEIKDDDINGDMDQLPF